MRNNAKRKANKVTKKEKINQYINKTLSQFPINSWEYPKPLLYVLKERSMSYMDHTFDNFWQIASQGVQPLAINYSRTDISRNKAAAMLLDSDFTHLIMLDVDHKHPVDIVQRLSQWVLRDKLNNDAKNIQVVGGLNFRRSPPHDPCCHLFGKDGRIFAPAEWEKGTLLEVDVIGTGSIMIAREVFEAMKPPWFYNIYDERRGWQDIWPGEDVGFSEKCREYGVKMFIDTGLTSPHIGEYMIDERNFRAAIKSRGMQIVKVENTELLHD